jgi:proline iminopeptidase
MKTLLIIVLFVTQYYTVNCQSLYIKTFGNKESSPVIFLHGGPGYNCANFEITTAKALSELGYFVIVYDRRGEGRSADNNAQFNFKETFSDLNSIYKQFGIKKATLIGHSFGGIVAVLYSEKHSDKINSVTLVGAPVNLQESFKTILNNSRHKYQESNDSSGLKSLDFINKLDTTTILYSSSCFMQAGKNGAYVPKEPSDDAKSIYSAMKADSLYNFVKQMTFQPPQGFWKNEKYTTIDLTNNIKELAKKKVPVFGFYGKEDGLYSAEQIESLKNIISQENIVYYDNCSHNVFIDRQKDFLQQFKSWVK